MKQPGLINSGTNLTLWSRELESYLRSITPRSSGGILVTQGPNGATFDQVRKTAPSLAALIPSFDFPWKLIPSTAVGETGSTYGIIEIYYGEVDTTTITGDGLSGVMSLSAPTQFTLDPCDAAGAGSAGDTSILYLCLTFDSTTREITSRTIGYTTIDEPDVPDNTATAKYELIGQVKLVTDGSGGLAYVVVNQQLNADVYTDQAYYLDDSEADTTTEIFFADTGRLQIFNGNAGEEQTALLKSDGVTDKKAFLQLFNPGSTNFIELAEEDSESDSTVSLYGYSGSDTDQSFELIADNITQDTNLNLAARGSSWNTLVDAGEVTTIGTCGDEGFELSANSDAQDAFLALYITDEEKVQVGVTPTTAEINGFAGTGEQNFNLKADTDSSSTALTLWDEGEIQKITAQISDEGVAEISGQSASGDTIFSLKADSSTSLTELYGEQGGDTGPSFTLNADGTNNSANLTLDDGGDESLEMSVIDAGQVQIIGNAGAGGQNFELLADDSSSETHLVLNDEGDAEIITIKIDSSEGVTYITGGAGTGANSFFISANNGKFTTLDLADNGDNSCVLEVDSSSNEASLVLTDSNGVGSYKTDQLSISDNEGGTVTIDIPTDGSGTSVNAYWQEISFCMPDGTTQKMKVLGTAPYS